MTREELAQAATVRRWFESARFDSDPPEEKDQRLGLLAEFCDHVGQGPDEMVAGLKRITKDGDTAISAKKRTAMNASIEEFVDKCGLTSKDAVVTGNQLRSFLVHNGIFIQGPVWRG